MLRVLFCRVLPYTRQIYSTVTIQSASVYDSNRYESVPPLQSHTLSYYFRRPHKKMGRKSCAPWPLDTGATKFEICIFFVPKILYRCYNSKLWWSVKYPIFMFKLKIHYLFFKYGIDDNMVIDTDGTPGTHFILVCIA